MHRHPFQQPNIVPHLLGLLPRELVVETLARPGKVLAIGVAPLMVLSQRLHNVVERTFRSTPLSLGTIDVQLVKLLPDGLIVLRNLIISGRPGRIRIAQQQLPDLLDPGLQALVAALEVLPLLDLGV